MSRRKLKASRCFLWIAVLNSQSPEGPPSVAFSFEQLKELKLMKHILTCAACLVFLTNCASIVSGDQQLIAVDAPNCKGASCKLSNEQGTFYISSTPGSVQINKSASALIIECERGAVKETMSVESGTKGMTFGNILVGGIIGAAVDASTGAAFVYPDSVTHPIQCE